jgi:hypothetical protein
MGTDAEREVMNAIISETEEGNYIVQVPNGIGGMYPLTVRKDDVRSVSDCLARISERWSEQHMPEDIHIEIRMYDDPRNEFGFDANYPQAAGLLREEMKRGGYCKHGVYVGGIGIDWMCGQCENGE